MAARRPPIRHHDQAGGRHDGARRVPEERDDRADVVSELCLLDGETLTITLTPGAKAITSDYFGNVIGRALLPNSDFAEWCLQPGANVVSLYVYEAGSPDGDGELRVHRSALGASMGWRHEV